MLRGASPTLWAWGSASVQPDARPVSFNHRCSDGYVRTTFLRHVHGSLGCGALRLGEHVQSAALDRIEFIDHSETVRRIQWLIDEAATSVVLASPYISFGRLRNISRSITSATKRKVGVSLIVRAPDANTRHKDTCVEELRPLVEGGLKLYTVRDLHAKIYASDRSAIVTSMNLLESSMNNSIEIGVWVPAALPEFQQIRGFFGKHIRNHWKEVRPDDLRPPPGEKSGGNDPFPEDVPTPRRSSPRSKSPRAKNAERERGYCIACRDRIPLNPDRPYCADDYAGSEEGDREEYCHHCGKDYSATFEKPLCRACFKAWSDEPPPPGDEDAPF